MYIYKTNNKMFLLKTKGTKVIKDYIQIRNENLALIALVQKKFATKEVKKHCKCHNNQIIEEFIDSLQYGVITKFDEKCYQ